ncbi:hypothetical protein VTK26DRAFT_2156 [Humicola hyalothermophila]
MCDVRLGGQTDFVLVTNAQLPVFSATQLHGPQSPGLDKNDTLPEWAQVAGIGDHVVFTAGLPLRVDRVEFEKGRQARDRRSPGRPLSRDDLVEGRAGRGWLDVVAVAPEAMYIAPVEGICQNICHRSEHGELPLIFLASGQISKLTGVGQHLRGPGRAVAVPEILGFLPDVLVVVGAKAFIYTEQGARRRVAPAPEGELGVQRRGQYGVFGSTGGVDRP